MPALISTALSLPWWVFVSILAAGTLCCVYHGGRGWNDHLIAGLVLCCFAVYGALGHGALESTQGPWLWLSMAALGTGPFLMFFHFWMMDQRRNPGDGLAWFLMLASQPAYAFVFWAWFLLVIRAPFAWFAAEPILWPGPWLLLPLALALWGLVWTWRGTYRVRIRRLPIEGLQVERLRVVQLSDLHYPTDLSSHVLGRISSTVRELGPDLVLASGDFVTPFSELPEQHAGLVERLSSMGAPVVACPGNHDQDCWEVLASEMRAAGMYPLRDETWELELGGMVVEVVGVDFRWKGVDEATAELLARHPRAPSVGLSILLCHDPRVFGGLPTERFQLAVAGHTHGGPLALDMFGVRWSVLSLFGLRDLGVDQQAGCWLHVHPGNWLVAIPPRLGSAPEITVLDLVPR